MISMNHRNMIDNNIYYIKTTIELFRKLLNYILCNNLNIFNVLNNKHLL